eukprot:TRINITY_DN5436_c0_g1_i3.p1 TRINITY_DN5436_c0_g1~~TRINITY_DN5436_c0_g1_i3.p1  ORF type:complete len:314 (+),score=73.37 TRINITY_DN5436_c0_g1_i3:742-1683(+)
MREKSLLLGSEIDILFRNIETIYSVTKKAFDLLEEHNTEFKFTKSFARVYLKTSGYLLEYGEFMDQENYSKADKLFKSVMKQNQAFQNLIHTVEDFERRVYNLYQKTSDESASADDLSFENLLLAPVQHGSKILSFLQKLLERTSEKSSEYSIIVDAIKVVGLKLEMSSLKFKKDLGKKKFLEIVHIAEKESLSLKDDGRFLLQEGPVIQVQIVEGQILAQQCYCYLINDHLLFCDMTSKALISGLRFGGSPLFSILDIPDHEISDYKNAFQISARNLGGRLSSILLCFPTAVKKNLWLQNFSLLLRAVNNKN